MFCISLQVPEVDLLDLRGVDDVDHLRHVLQRLFTPPGGGDDFVRRGEPAGVTLSIVTLRLARRQFGASCRRLVDDLTGLTIRRRRHRRGAHAKTKPTVNLAHLNTSFPARYYKLTALPRLKPIICWPRPALERSVAGHSRSDRRRGCGDRPASPPCPKPAAGWPWPDCPSSC